MEKLQNISFSRPVSFLRTALSTVKMPSLYSSLQSISRVALAQLALSPQVAVLGGSPPVCTNPQTSCQNTAAVSDTCCFNTPGGLLLQTQFWDYNPATGPSDSWTVHGLWPDHCDGTYDANCDTSRAYTGISQILQAAGATSLLSYMETYWKDYQGNDESFWEHEWAKHGTCISTLNTNCYTNYTPQEELVDYFNKTVELFMSLPSYQVSSFGSQNPKLPHIPSYTANDNLIHVVPLRCLHSSVPDRDLQFRGHPRRSQCSSRR